MIVKSVEKKENNTVTFQAEFDSAEFEAAVNKVYAQEKKKILVPGFRKGKAPRLVIEGMYGADVFYEGAVEALSPDAFSKGVEQEKLDAVGRPTLAKVDVSDDKVLTLTFETAIYPEVELGQYLGLTAKKPPVVVTDIDIENELKYAQERCARQISVDRAAAMDDTVVIDFEGFLDGKPFEGGKAEDYSLKLGSGQFIPGFEEQLVGINPGTEADINLTFPEEYDKKLAGKAVVFHVNVKKVEVTEVPDLDDEFAKDVSEFDTFEEYKANVVQGMKAERDKTCDDVFHENLLAAAIGNMKVTIPDAMVDEQIEVMTREYQQNFAAQGLRFQDYLDSMSMNLEMFGSQIRPDALKRVQTNILLAKVAEAENIEATDEDMEAGFTELAEAYNMKIEDIKKSVPEKAIKADVITKKAMDLIYKSGIPTEADEEKAEKETAEEAE